MPKRAHKLTGQGVRDLNPPTSRPRRTVTNPCLVGLHMPGRWRKEPERGLWEEQLCANCGAVLEQGVLVKEAS